VFIELTDLLRCPAKHDEGFLVLIPNQMESRSIRSGLLGCPVCAREYHIVDGIALFEVDGQLGTPAPLVSGDEGADAGALVAFLGIEGPGGYVGLFGSAAARAEPLSALLPGVHFAAVNPPEATPETPVLSVLRAPTSPFRSRSLRGAVLGDSDPAWQEEAARSVLPGLRVVGRGHAPEIEELEPMGEAGGWWVARRTS
jgi:uncharacterized protein YbaR (Trm112 family)